MLNGTIPSDHPKTNHVLATQPELRAEAVLSYLNGDEPQPNRRYILLKAFGGEINREQALQQTTAFAESEDPWPIDKLPVIIQAWLVIGEREFCETYRAQYRPKGVRSIPTLESVGA
ncbi:MAG: hypothetical protein Q7S86_03895 [bacterium]|nr:hypothetical protein [bacterium]